MRGMSRRWGPALPATALAAASLGCSTRDVRIATQRERFESFPHRQVELRGNRVVRVVAPLRSGETAP